MSFATIFEVIFF